MQTRKPTEEEKQRFLRYVEEKKIAKQDSSDQDVDIISIDYMQSCIDDIISKMENLESYNNLSEQEKENVENNLALEFIEFMLIKVDEYAKENNLKDQFVEMGQETEYIEDLFDMLIGLVSINPALSEFIVTTIILKYKSICDEMGFSYQPNLIYSLIKS